MINDKIKMQLMFLSEADKMKRIMRQTMLTDMSRAENDAEHSWHFALTALTLFEYCGLDGADINRVIKMALLHDMVEIYAGDTFAYDTAGNLSKEKREKESAEKLFSLLPEYQAVEFSGLWEEFERMESPDAIYANAVDRFQSFYNNYLTDGYPWVKHGINAGQIYERMAPVKTAIPALWEFIVRAVDECIEKGFVSPPPASARS